jgi:lysozyme
VKTSDAGLRKIALFEGTVLTVYHDQAGVPTIGTGHALTADDKASHRFDHGITAEQAKDLLAKDVADAEAAVTRMVKVGLSQEQFDALVSWTFNLGSGALQNSKLLVRLNQGDYDAVPGEMLRWCKRKDPKTGLLVEDAGLLARRRAEGAIWESGHDHPATATAVDAATVADAAERAFGLIIEPGEFVDELNEPTHPDIEEPA